MRFTMSVVGKNARPSSKHSILPGNVVRMDSGEEFRILFENDWVSGGRVDYAYEQTRGSIRVEGGELCAPATVFQYRQTKRAGEGRILCCEFYRDGLATIPSVHELILINNDYNADGSAVHLGDTTGDRIPGRATSAEDNPDRHESRNNM